MKKITKLLLIIGIVFLMQVPAWGFTDKVAESSAELPIGVDVIAADMPIRDVQGVYFKSEMPGVDLELADVDDESVSQVLLEYLQVHQNDILGNAAGIDSLVFDYSAYIEPRGDIRPAGTIFVRFNQYVEGRKVDQAGVTCVIKELPAEGRFVLYYIDASLVPAESVSIAESMQDQEVLKQEIAGVFQADAGDVKQSAHHRVLKVVDGIYTDVLSFDHDHWRVFVNAEDGSIIGVQDSMHHQLDMVPPPTVPTTLPSIIGSVSGRGVEFDPANTPVLDVLALPHLELSIGGQQFFSNQLGNFKIRGIGSGQLQAALKGRWVDVIPIQGQPLMFSQQVSYQNPVNVLFNPTGNAEFDVSQVNAFHFTTKAHDFVKNTAPYFTALDRQIQAAVNANAACNAGYDDITKSMSFFAAGTVQQFQCINTAYDTIVVHEYGHFVDDMGGGIWGTNEGSGLSEGGADLLANYVTGQPLNGENMETQNRLFRTADNNYQYPNNPMAWRGHVLGQAWSGFGWHFREALIRDYGQAIGVDIAEAVVIPTFFTNPANIPEALIHAIFIDDNDADLSNGTPHLQQIEEAGARHGIYPIVNMSFAQIDDPIEDAYLQASALNTIPIRGIAETSSINMQFSSYQLFYGSGKSPTSWTPIAPPVTTEVTSPGLLGTWDITNIPTGTYTIQLRVNVANSVSFQKRRVVHVNGPWVPIYIQEDSWTPAVSDKYVAWNLFNVFPGVMLYDVAANTQAVVAPNEIGFTVEPKLSGDYLVYHGHHFARNMDEVYLYDIRAQNLQVLRAIGGGGDIRSTGISYPYVVWIERIGSGTTKKLYNIQTQATVSLGSHGSREDNIDMWGNKVVWQVEVGSNQQIYYCEINPMTNQCLGALITTTPGERSDPKVSGDKIVFVEEDSVGMDQVVLYDIQTQSFTRLTNAELGTRNPEVEGDWVVWVEQEFASSNLRLYCISTNQMYTLTNVFEASEGYPAMSGKVLVWSSTLGGIKSFGYDGFSIFGAVLP